MKHAILSLLDLLLSTSAFAVPEANFQIVNDLFANRDHFFSNATFTGVDHFKISYTKYGSDVGARGCMVLVPGQAEAAMKYLEVAYDLHQAGFSPIYTIDNRGQGASQRPLPDPQMNSVNNFSDYADDLETMVNTVVLKDPACQGHKLSLLAHSMGGAIAAVYLEKVGANSPFRKAAVTSPMFRIIYPAPRTEDSVITETFFACNTPFGPKCDGYAPGQGPYNPNSVFDDNLYTHSQVRFGFKKAIFAQWPNLILGGPTVRWVRQAAIADRDMRKPENAKRIAASLLVFQAENDKIVDNSGQNEFCAAMGRNCQIIKVQGSNHESLMESDSIRDYVMANIVSFFD